jgi:parallel beta-helix repeat protein
MFCIQNVSYLVEAADTIIVDDDGTGDYTDIQTAINNAGVGDYIVVKDGTYAEQLTVNVNALTIVAASGETPTLYLSSYSVGIDVTATDVLIEGFEIYGNGSLTGGPSPTIRANTGAHGLTVHDNSFKVLTGEIGQIALYINSGVTNVLFTSNTLTNYEHSVYHAARISGQQAYYGSIQDVIDIADAGETVIVADGIYTEQITVNKSITLTSTTGDYISSEAVIDLGSLATYAIEFEQGCDGATVKGLEIIDSYGIYVNLNAGGEGNVTIQDNYIHDLFVSGAITGGFVVDASCWPPLENWTIQDNILENITGSLSSGLRPENMKNVVITGNTIRNMGYSGILLINVDGGVVSNNIVSNIGRAGIQVDNYCTRVITITYNVVTQANTGSHSGYGGIRFYGQYIPDPHGRPPAEITVMRNTCNDSYNGLAVRKHKHSKYHC